MKTPGLDAAELNAGAPEIQPSPRGVAKISIDPVAPSGTALPPGVSKRKAVSEICGWLNARNGGHLLRHLLNENRLIGLVRQQFRA